MSFLYGTRENEDHQAKDFTYKAETGPIAEGLPEDYKYPDDGGLTRKGFQRKSRLLEPPAPITEEPYDPESELASFLYMNITGQIETSNIITTDLVQVKYTFISGSEWDLIDGNKSQESQFAKRIPGSDLVTWNMEFQVGYRSLSPEGWPIIVIELKSPTRTPDVNQIKGYACIHVPTFPGITTKVAKIFCPVKDSWWSMMKAKIWGPRCEIIEDPQQIVDCEGREVTSVFYSGQVNVTFNVTQRNFERFGYKTF